MQIKSFALLLLVTVCSHFSFAQQSETVIRIDEIVGDTIDREEKLRLKLFPNVRNENYQFAVCIMENDSMKLKVTYFDSTTAKFPYSSALLFEEIDRIYLNQHADYTVPSEPRSGKPILKITSGSSNRTLKLKKGKLVEVNMKENNTNLRIRIQKILVNDEIAIVVKKEAGRTQLISLSEISHIYKYKRFEHIAYKTLGGLNFLMGGLLVTLTSENYQAGSILMASGIVPWLFKNEKIRIDQAEISVTYK